MAAKTKYKKLTNKEKEENKQIKARLREAGALPPAKQRLNRDKFAKEVLAEWEGFKFFEGFSHLQSAIAYMTPYVEARFSPVTPEQVGVLKMLKIAIDLKAYEEKLIAQGKTTYNYMEMFREVVEPIIKL